MNDLRPYIYKLNTRSLHYTLIRSINTRSNHIMATSVLPSAYQLSPASPDWLNKGDNAWQMISATLVGLQSVPGLVILYGSVVKKKWAVNSAFMALYAFSAVVICWVTWGYKMSFGEKLLPFWGKAGPALGQKFLIKQAALPASTHHYNDGSVFFVYCLLIYNIITI